MDVFVASSTCEAGSDCLPSNAIHAISKINETSISVFISFFKDEQEKGNLPSTMTLEQSADFLLTIQFGLAVMARSGINLARLKEVINHAISKF